MVRIRRTVGISNEADVCNLLPAMMEYHWNKEQKIATNVFEYGLKQFSEDVDYVVRYLDFLISTNDDTSKRTPSI